MLSETKMVFQTETALLYDAVLLLAQALNNLHRAQVQIYYFANQKWGKSTSTMVLKLYNSTAFLPLNFTFYTLFYFQIYI